MLSPSALEVGLFAIQTLNPQPPQECIDAFMHGYCLVLTPPCDPISHLRLPICDRSCEAFIKLRSEGVCTELDNFIMDLADSSMSTDLQILKDLYFAFNCRDTSTYVFYDGTKNFTQNGQCTRIVSPDAEGNSHNI